MVDDKQLRDFMDAAMGVPPGRVTVAAVRRRLVRRRIREAAGVLAVVVVVAAIGVAASGRVFGAAPGSAASQPNASTIYVAYAKAGAGETSSSQNPPVSVIPINAATNTAGNPVRVGDGGTQIVFTPDGRTAYILDDADGTVIPFSTATNTPGQPIRVAHARYFLLFAAITPNGKTLYVANTMTSAVTPISTASNKAGKPIHVGPAPEWIAFRPDGKTAYVVDDGHKLSQPGLVVPINTATNIPGKPITVGRAAFQIVLTPNGKTAYVDTGESITPISTATDTAGEPIRLHGNPGQGVMAMTPDGKTIYAETIHPWTVVPISTASNTAGNPINLPKDSDYNFAAPGQMAITPDGRTAYVVLYRTRSVLPINTATNTAGPPIRFGSDCTAEPHQRLPFGQPSIAITPDGKTAYFACANAVVPISTATDRPGKPIHVPIQVPQAIAIRP